MIRLNTLISPTLVVLLGSTIVSGQQQTTAIRKVYDDSTSILQTWQDPNKKQEYLLSGSEPRISVGLTFNGKAATEATINLGAGRSIRVQSAGDRIVTSFFESQIGKEISVLYDLDTNGSWDVRTWRSGKCAIFFDSAWHQATELSGVLNGTPKAIVDGVQYEFSVHGWRASTKEEDARQRK